MKAYKLINNYDCFQVLQLDTLQIAEQLGREDLLRQIKRITSTSNSPIASEWGYVKSNFRPMNGTQAIRIPDISVWKGAGLVFSGRAHAYFKLMLEPFGEFLPVDVEGHEFHLIHIMTEGKVDLDNSSRENDKFGEPTIVTALQFDSNDLENNILFKSEYEFYLTPSAMKNLKSCTQSVNLKAYFLKRIWWVNARNN